MKTVTWIVGPLLATSALFAQGMPKPAPEMDAFAKMKGTWKCDGKVTVEGKEQVSKSTAVWSMELDGWWATGRITEAKSKDNPMPFKFVSYITFDPASKSYARVDFDNRGGWTQATAKPGGETMEWTGEGMMMGKKVPFKETIATKGPKAVTVTGEAGDAKWDISCKK